MSYFGQGAPNPEKMLTAQEPTYLEYLEFGHREFEKFRRMPPVTQADIARADLDELCRRLAED